MSLDLEALSAYPHIPDLYGIDFVKLSSTDREQWRSESGRKISGYILKNLVVVVDEDSRLFPRWEGRKMHAIYYEDDCTVKFNLQTVGKLSPERHKDFFAGVFVESVIRFFESNSGSVKRWECEWLPESDNYRKLYDLIDQGLSAPEAARLTWTGLLAMKLGFNLVEGEPRLDSMNGKPKIICLFER